jgi:hypothetical protein
MTLPMHLSSETARYLTMGSWFSISLPNLIVICVMVTLFVLAIVVPFPRDDHDARDDS